MIQLLKCSLIALILLLLQSCTQTSVQHASVQHALRESVPAANSVTRLLAVYEPWFGHPQHISVGYSSQDPVVIKKQIEKAKNLGISGFVVDWYGDREPFLDKSYALIQRIAGEQNFNVAVMFDESEQDSAQATDDALAAFQKLHDTYLTPDAAGRKAYLEYRGRPVIFIFPKGGHTDWNRVRTETDRWNPPPLLIHENLPTPLTNGLDGFYAWINPGKKGWSADGSNWGEDYLRDFYRTMQTKYPEKIVVGAAWAGFDDRKASWGLNRYMSQRCGETFADTTKLQRDFYPADKPIPFMLIATWNDYEESTAIERGLEKCKR